MIRGSRRKAVMKQAAKRAGVRSALKKATSPYTTTSYLGSAAPKRQKKRTRSRR